MSTSPDFSSVWRDIKVGSKINMGQVYTKIGWYGDGLYDATSGHLVAGVSQTGSYCDHYIIQSSHNQLKMSLSKIPLKLYSSSLYYNLKKKLLLE